VFVNGINSYTFAGVALGGTGQQGLAAVYNSGLGTFFDVLDGRMLGFASYDSALAPAEVAQHAAAFAVPEPTTVGLLGLAALGLARRRRASWRCD
jgi:hypothetical protein